jgi:hypothetical protein
MSTPEGKVKAAVNRVLAPYIARGDVYTFMPVQSGYGKKTLDYLLCVRGHFVAIETKAPGKKLTALQQAYAREIEAAGGLVFAIDTEAYARELVPHICEGLFFDAGTCQRKTQNGGSAVGTGSVQPIPQRKRAAA